MRRLLGVLRQGVVLAGILVLWQLVAVVFSIPPYILPRATAVLATVSDNWFSQSQLWYQTSVTLGETLAGLLCAIAVAVPVAVAVTAWPRVGRVVYPALVIGQTVPIVAIAPVLIVWFGVGLTSKVCVAFLISLFVLVTDLALGLVNFPPSMVHLAQSMGATKWSIYRRIRLPNALPNFFSALKVSVVLSLVGSIVSELVGSNRGLGYILNVGLGAFNLNLVFASIVLMAAVGVVLFSLVEIVQGFAIPWSQASRTQDLMSRR